MKSDELHCVGADKHPKRQYTFSPELTYSTTLSLKNPEGTLSGSVLMMGSTARVGLSVRLRAICVSSGKFTRGRWLNLQRQSVNKLSLSYRCDIFGAHVYHTYTSSWHAQTQAMVTISETYYM